MELFLFQRVRRHFDLELPRNFNRRRRWPLLIALHGYQGNKDSMMRLARRIAAGKMVVISLQGPHQFFFNDQNRPKYDRPGFGWGTTWKMEDSVALHHADLLALIRLARRRYRADSRRVFLLGFSQACAYNYRFVFTYPNRVRGVIGVCGGVPKDWDENRHYRAAQAHVLHIAAIHDRWYSHKTNLEFRRKLAQRARTLDFRFYNSIHRFPRSAIPQIRRWIEKHL